MAVSTEEAVVQPVAAERARAAEFGDDAGIPIIFRVGAVIGFVVLILPAVIVVLSGLNAGDYLTFPPQGLSLRWVVHFLTTPTFRNAYLFSFLLATVVTLIATTLGTMAALFLTRVSFPGRSLMRAYFLAPLMLPGLVLGMALYIFYIFVPIGLARTMPGLAIGHLLVTIPYVIGTVSAALYNFDLSLEEAARSLGASPLAAFRKVTLPIIAPGVMAGSIFAFIVSFGQFDVSLFLSTPNHEPLPITMYMALRYQFDPTAAAAGVFAIFLVIASTLGMSRLMNLAKFAGLKFS